jgi:hypothetical protein
VFIGRSEEEEIFWKKFLLVGKCFGRKKGLLRQVNWWKNEEENPDIIITIWKEMNYVFPLLDGGIKPSFDLYFFLLVCAVVLAV